MAGNTQTSIPQNLTFTTGVVALVVGVLNPPNSAQTVWDAGVGMTYASMTTVVTGSPASFTILLEGTYDGNTWTTLATTTAVSGETQYATGLVPFTNLRARCTAVNGGSSPTVSVYATASPVPFTNTGGGTAPGTTVIQGVGGNKTPWSVASTSLAPSVAGAGSTGAAPTAGTSITTATAGATGTYLVEFAGGFGATAESTQLDNIGIKINTTFKTAIPLANLANTMSQPYIVYFNLTAADQVSVYVINNGSAGSIYKGFISITQVA